MTVIQGHVVDPDGHPVASAAVYVVVSPVPMPDIAQLTDEQGRFEIGAPVAGRYTIGTRSDPWGEVHSDVDVGNVPSVFCELQFVSRKE